MWTLKMFLPRDVFWDVWFSISSAFSNGAFEHLSRTTMLIKALELNFKANPQPRMVLGVCVWVCPNTAFAKQQHFNMHCHYTDGQKRVVSVPWQYLLTDIVHYAKRSMSTNGKNRSLQRCSSFHPGMPCINALSSSDLHTLLSPLAMSCSICPSWLGSPSLPTE